MRVAHKIGIAIVVVVVLIVLLLLPRRGAGQSGRDFGDCIVYYSAVPTEQLLAEVAHRYGIERSPHRGLLNIAIEDKHDTAHTISAAVSADVSDLTGHRQHFDVRETAENGDIDYLGEFSLQGTGTYLFTVRIARPGHDRPYVLTFSQDYVVD